MSIFRVLALIFITGHLTWPTEALNQEFAPKWISDIFCKGVNGIVRLPWDCTGYLYCTSRGTLTTGSWFKCNVGLYFDVNLPVPGCTRSTRSCVSGQAVADQLCSSLPSLKFPHPASCALYYDCSQTEVWSHVDMRMYENECPHPQIFDPDLAQCRDDNAFNPIACINKPSSQADYRLQSAAAECDGKADGFHTTSDQPPFSSQYIVCKGGSLLAHQTCLLDRVFDPITKTCVIDFRASLQTYCVQNPSAVFLDSRSCARYYNCSQASAVFRSSQYLTECQYTYLYDTTTKGCVLFDEMATPCGDRFEPINPCDYDVGQCLGRTNCIPCVAKCQGLDDGPHPFPNLPNTRFHMTCRGGRLIDILKCPENEIYHHDQKLCMPEVADQVEANTCSCMEDIDFLRGGLMETQSRLEEIIEQIAVKSPFDCTQPPITEFMNVDIRYHNGKAEAHLTCVEGYTHCSPQEDQYAVCSTENTWDMDWISSCVKNVWTDMLWAELSCSLDGDETLVIKGRAEESPYKILLHKAETSLLEVSVDVDSKTLTIVEDTNAPQTFETSLDLTQQLTWYIDVTRPSYTLYADGYYVATIAKTTQVIGRPTVEIGEEFKTEEIRFYPRGSSEHRLNWSPYSCPDPPLVVGASVSLSYTESEALATYKCQGSRIICHGESDVLRCSDQTGWGQHDISCTDTVFLPPEGQENLRRVELCPLTLGSALEFWISPEQNGFSVLLLNGLGDPVFEMRRGATGNTAELRRGDTVDQSLDLSPFVEGGTQYHVLLVALTDALQVIINNGEVVTDFNHYIHGAETFISNIILQSHTKKVIYHPPFMSGVERAPQTQGIQIDDIAASSQFNVRPRVIIDGNPGDEVFSTGSCWSPDVSDPFLPWIQVDLAKQHFITAVKVDLKNIGITEVGNLAVETTASGSEGRDADSVPVKVIDGVYGTAASSASCYVSAETVADPVLYVDLGALHQVSSVALQRPELPATYDAQFEKIGVYLYNEDPKENANAVRFDCFVRTSVMEPYERIPCMSIQNVRYVEIKKTSGDAGLYVCEVEVFGAVETKLHDFTVNVYETDPSTESESPEPKLCVTHEGDLAPGMTHMLTCAEGVWGRYIRVQMDEKTNDYDSMSICELDVYGDKVIKTEWSPTDCPPPPVYPNMAVSLTWTSNSAIAHYSCMEGSIRCNEGTNDITCSSSEGWSGTPEPCAKEGDFKSNTHITWMKFCPLKLGDAVELHLTIGDEFHIQVQFSENDGVVFSMNWDTESFNVNFLKDIVDMDPSRFKVEKERDSKVIITHLSLGVHIEVDGVGFYVRADTSMYTANEMLIIGSTLREAIFHRPGDAHVLFPLKSNLAGKVDMDSGASSIWEFEEMKRPVTNAHDGKLETCWVSASDDEQPTWSLDLYKAHYITHLVITPGHVIGCPSEECLFGTHDFTARMFYELNEMYGDRGEVCLTHSDALPYSVATRLECQRQVSGRHLQITATNRKGPNDLFALCEVEVFGGIVVRENPRNLALFRPTDVSSSQEGAQDYKAVDGIEDFRTPSETCWAANADQFPAWLRVILDDIYYVSHVAVRSRVDTGDMFDEALQNFAVTVSFAGSYLFGHLCREYKDIIPPDTRQELKCNKLILGKYVYFTKKAKEFEGQSFGLCEVEVYGDRTSLAAETTNIALRRLVTSSSRTVPPERAVDGIKLTDTPDSCWTADSGESRSWLLVQLDGHHMVSAVEITTLACNGCEDLVKQFDVKVIYDDYNWQEQMAFDKCVSKTDALPAGSSTRFECTPSALPGLLVLFEAKDRTAALVICEFAVFGQKISNAEYSPSFGCPEPPRLENACVDVCYEGDGAVATYTCNTNYTMCQGVNKLYCNSREGWQGMQGQCVKTVWEVNSGARQSLRNVPICAPKLGEGFELWILISAGVEQPHLKFLSGLGQDIRVDFILGLGIDSASSEDEISFNMDGVPRDEVTRIGIVFLSEKMMMLRRGKNVAVIDNVDFSHLYQIVTDGVEIKKIQPLSGYVDNLVVTVPYEGNMAVYKSATSSETTYNPYNLVDGNYDDGTRNTADVCWLAGLTGPHWVRVDLEGQYIVTSVVMYQRMLGRCIVCNGRTHDLNIHVMATDTSDPMFCGFYAGALPHDSHDTVRCADNVIGRFVHISTTFLRNKNDLTTICEVEVYGDKVVAKSWSVHECPPPEVKADMSVQVTYSEDTALATYTCMDNYEMCDGSNVLECRDDTGWQGTVGDCIQTTLRVPYGTSMESPSQVSSIPICSFKLGEGIEFSVIPDPEGYVGLAPASRSFIDVKMIFGEGFELTSVDKDGNQSPLEIPRNNGYVSGSETVVTVFFLSEHFLVLLEGEFVSHFAYTEEIPMVSALLYYKVDFRSMRPIGRYYSGITRTRLRENLAVDKPSTVSTTADGGDKDLVNDGNTVMNSLCWAAQSGDTGQFYQVDLGAYYFIREVLIYPTDLSECAACAGNNHDFAIDVLQTSELEELTMRCAFFTGAMPDDAATRIMCNRDVWGRYVRISKSEDNTANDEDLLAFCEVRVFGDVVMDKEHGKCRPYLMDMGRLMGSGMVGEDSYIQCDEGYTACDPIVTCTESLNYVPEPGCSKTTWSLVEPGEFVAFVPCDEFGHFVLTAIPRQIDNNRFTIHINEKDPDKVLVFEFTTDIKIYSQKNGESDEGNVATHSGSLLPPNYPFKLEISQDGDVYTIYINYIELTKFTTTITESLPHRVVINGDIEISDFRFGRDKLTPRGQA